ncbi:hypothetical protein TNCV_1844501, partial [Trichonephila clavipes]
MRSVPHGKRIWWCDSTNLRWTGITGLVKDYLVPGTSNYPGVSFRMIYSPSVDDFDEKGCPTSYSKGVYN